MYQFFFPNPTSIYRGYTISNLQPQLGHSILICSLLLHVKLNADQNHAVFLAASCLSNILLTLLYVRELDEKSDCIAHTTALTATLKVPYHDADSVFYSNKITFE